MMTYELQKKDEAIIRKEVASHLLSDKPRLIVGLDDPRIYFQQGLLYHNMD